jgi:cellulose synthase/poly-beta-1,6-N-acetylglucosamine synthase-like glycosyltransferase
MYCSVIIPAQNARRTISECILAVLSQSVPRDLYEVIVVDAGSSDATAAIARSHGVRVIPRPPIGMAAARNIGARAARGEILLFLDPDCIPALDWIAQMIAPFADPSVVAVKGAYQTHETALLPRLIQAEYEDAYQRLAETNAGEIVGTYSAAYRRSAFLAAGGFDPTLASMEDVDLSLRLVRSGQRVVFAPKARVYHAHGTHLRHYVARMLRRGLWRPLVYARHPDRPLGQSPASDEVRTQIRLAALAVVSALLGSRWQRLRPIAGIFLAIFTSTTVPFAWRARRAGTDVAVASPFLILVRALALGAGLAIGNASLIGRQAVDQVARAVRIFRITGS